MTVAVTFRRCWNCPRLTFIYPGFEWTRLIFFVEMFALFHHNCAQ